MTTTKPSYVLPDFRPLRPTWHEQNTPLGLTGEDYQATGSTYLIQNTNALLLDEMGLGKSKQLIDAVAYVHERTPQSNVLIVAKASSLGGWRNELRMFSPLCDVHVLRGTPRQRKAMLWSTREHSLRYFIVSWQTMRADIDFLSRLGWDWIVLDEAHMAKSTPLNDNQAQQAQAIHRLQGKRKTAMTGTFIINSAEDSWNVLRWLGIESRTWAQFETETLRLHSYTPGGNRRIRIVVGYHPAGLQKLRSIIGNNMVRRLKDEEMPALPPFIRQDVEVLLGAEETTRYRSVEKEALLYFDTLDKDTRDAVSETSETLRLKQITTTIEPFLDRQYVSSKIAATLDLVEDLTASGQKVLIGTQFVSAVESLTRVLAQFNPAVVHGGISTNAKAGEDSPREQQVQKFQTDPTCKVFIASVAACREALTLTAASAIIHVDKEWSPEYVAQFEARARRIGSEGHNAINVYSLIARQAPTLRHPEGEETIDAGLKKRLAAKAAHVEQLTEREYA